LLIKKRKSKKDKNNDENFELGSDENKKEIQYSNIPNISRNEYVSHPNTDDKNQKNEYASHPNFDDSKN